MALKSPAGDVVSSFLTAVRTLRVEKNAKLRLQTYESLTQLLMKGACLGDVHDSLSSIAVPITLQDVSTGKDNLILAALGFLGGLLQVVKLPIDQQISVVDIISKKLRVVTDKNQSKKLMWCLANVQFGDQLPTESLANILTASCTYLGEKPPVFSLSTVCESLNAVRNLGNRNRPFFLENLAKIVLFVTPWLFYEADRIRELSLACLAPHTGQIAQRKLLDASFQKELKDKHYSALKQLISAETADSLQIWGFLIECFGTELHDSVSLLNELLKIEESALKSKRPDFRQQALEHWKDIIDCFALNPVVLNNSKRIKLVLVPLKSTDTRTVEFAKTKVHLWWHLLSRLGPDAARRFNEVTLPLLHFCFVGPATGKGTAFNFPGLMPLAAACLAGILSPVNEFTIDVDGATLSRASLYLEQEDFDRHVLELRQFVLTALGIETGTSWAGCGEVHKAMLRSFFRRCTSDANASVLEALIVSLLNKISVQPGLMEVVLDTFGDVFDNNHLMGVLTANLAALLRWYAANEPLATHPLVHYLAKFFEAGITWNLSLFSTAVTRALAELDSAADMGSIIELWSKFASALIAKSESVSLSRADHQSILLPLTWRVQDSTTESFLLPWCTLLSVWLKEDPAILKHVLNPLGCDQIDVDGCVVRFVLKALRPDMDLHLADMTTWIKCWTLSWIKRVDSVRNREDSTSALVNFILCMVDELDKDVLKILVQEMVLSLQAAGSSKEVTDVLLGVFGPTSVAVKSTNAQKLRQQVICKEFFPLVPKPTGTRTRNKPKQFDDFVVVPPPEKTPKRVLTEHQKEVMRSKRRSGNVPAMYNDLSQQSNSTEPSLMEPLDCPITIVSTCSMAMEEGALLEPPSPISKEQEQELTSPNNDKENPNGIGQSPAIGELFKKDLKLRSKVSVQVAKLTPKRRSARLCSESPVAVEDSPSTNRQRPCPASKKPGYVSLSGSPAKCAARNPAVSSLDSAPDTVGHQLPGSPSKGLEKQAPPEEQHDMSAGEPMDVDESCCDERALLSGVPSDQQPELEADSSTPIDKPFEPLHAAAESADASLPRDQAPDESADSLATRSHEAQPLFSDETGEVLADQSQESELKPESVALTASSDELEEDHHMLCSSHTASASDESDVDLQKDPKRGSEEIPGSQDEGETPVLAETSVAGVFSALAVPASPTPDREKASDGNHSGEEGPFVEVSDAETVASTQGSVAQNHDATVPEMAVQSKVPQLQRKHLLMTFSSARGAKRLGPVRGGPSKGTGKCSSKRGAQMLELSRKMQNEPPNKKVKVVIAEEVIEPKGAAGELAITPEGSPARSLPWIPRVYSPYASPSTSILKKKHAEELDDSIGGEGSPVTSASKSRRVSFADPEVSHSVKISPPHRLPRTTRTRRSLIVSYGNTGASDSCAADPLSTPPGEESVRESDAQLPSENSPCDVTAESQDEPPASLPDSDRQNVQAPPSTEDCSQLSKGVSPAVESRAEPTETKLEQAIYAEMAACDDDISAVVDRLTQPSSKNRVVDAFGELGIRTVGNLCALTEAALCNIALNIPAGQTAKQVLEEYFASKSASATTLVTSESADSDEMVMDSPVKPCDGSELSPTPEGYHNGQAIDESVEPIAFMSHEKTDGSSPIACMPEEAELECEEAAVLDPATLDPRQELTTVAFDFKKLGATEILALVEQHPAKDDIVSALVRRYLTISVNGQALPI